MFFYLGEKIEKVDNKIRLMKNKSNSWKYGYNEAIDTVIISKNGTLGDIFRVNGLNIGLPEKPTDDEIINSDRTPRNQKWERREMPQGLTESTQRKFEAYIDCEYMRRENGAWIYINGQAVYLSGVYYYFLQWIREGNKYPNFRVIQNELMLFWEACKADNRCFGICFVKPRRFGWSALAFTELLEAGTKEENKLLGMMSKKGADASKIFGRMVRSFKRLPFFFMPDLDGTTTPKKELVFADQAKKRRVGQKITAGSGLDTTIAWHNTEINAMDGDEIFRSVIDEFGKFPKDVPASEFWSIVQTSHTIGSSIVGKAMVGSTVNAMKKGGAEFKSVYKDSDPNDRQDTGETKSGLYRLFIPARFCLAGFFDQFGFSVVEDPTEIFINDLNDPVKIGSKTYLKQKLEALKGKPEKYNERLRQFPDTDKEAFRDEAEDCGFNLMNLMEQIDHNTDELNDRFDNEKLYYGNDIVDRGNLFWKDGIPDTEVIWKPDYENGRWFVKRGCHPPEQYRNKREMKMKNGMYAFAPTGENLGCFGVDPYNRTKNADGRGSKGSIHLFLKPNTSDLPGDEFAVEYIDRPRTVTQFFEDCLMSCVYWSIPMLGELSNEALFKHFKDRKYRHFCLNNPIKKYHELSPTEKEYGGYTPQGDTAVDAQFHAMEEYVESRVGVAKDESVRPLGEMGVMPFTRTLIQIKDVDVETAGGRRKYDAYISSSLALLGCQRRVKPKEEVKEEPMEYFMKYDNSGTYSKAI